MNQASFAPTAPRDSHPGVPDSGSASQRGPVWFLPTLLGVGALVVFAAHFRPGEVAFLEEWPLAEIWTYRGGEAFIANFFEWSLSRPLHLVPTALGLALTGGAPWGIFLILGLVAASQFLAIVWALRSTSRSYWISGAVALFIALHPLWPGGYLQRFLPAQTAALALVIAAGLLIRWLQQGRARWVVSAALVLVIGLCVYPGPAVAAPLMALVMALAVRSSSRRRLLGVIVVTGASAAVTVYSLLIARLIVPGGATYEAGNMAAGSVGGPRSIVAHVGTVLLGPGFVVFSGILLVAVISGILAVTGSIPDRAGWLMAATAIVSPVCTLVFFGNVAWLQDVERVAYTTSLGLGLALMVWPIVSLGRRPKLEVVIAGVLIVGSILGAARGILHWQPYIALQHQLFAELEPVVREAEGDEIVVVVDHSGTFGTEYTLPQSYISSASHVMHNDSTPVWLCSLAEDPALFGAGVCDPRDTGGDLRLVRTFTVPQGTVDIFIGVRPPAG